MKCIVDIMKHVKYQRAHTHTHSYNPFYYRLQFSFLMFLRTLLREKHVSTFKLRSTLVRMQIHSNMTWYERSFILADFIFLSKKIKITAHIILETIQTTSTITTTSTTNFSLENAISSRMFTSRDGISVVTCINCKLIFVEVWCFAQIVLILILFLFCYVVCMYVMKSF